MFLGVAFIKCIPEFWWISQTSISSPFNPWFYLGASGYVLINTLVENIFYLFFIMSGSLWYYHFERSLLLILTVTPESLKFFPWYTESPPIEDGISRVLLLSSKCEIWIYLSCPCTCDLIARYLERFVLYLLIYSVMLIPTHPFLGCLRIFKDVVVLGKLLYELIVKLECLTFSRLGFYFSLRPSGTSGNFILNALVGILVYFQNRPLWEWARPTVDINITLGREYSCRVVRFCSRADRNWAKLMSRLIFTHIFDKRWFDFYLVLS